MLKLSEMSGGALLLLVFAALLYPAGAARGAFLGDTVKPFASVSEVYDSNVFRVKDKEALQALTGDTRMGDLINVTSVGSEFHYDLSRQKLDLLLMRDFIMFGRLTRLDTSRTELSGNLALNLLDKVKVKIDAGYLKAPLPRADYQAAELNDMTSLRYAILLGYELGSGLGLEASYRRAEVAFSLPQYRANEYGDNQYSGTLSYRTRNDTRLYASYQREDRAYPEDLRQGEVTVKRDNVSDSLRAGFSKKFTPRTQVSGYVGYLNRRHSAVPIRDFSGVVGKAELDYGVSPKLGLVLNGELQIYEETYKDRAYSVSNSVGAGVVYQVSEKVKASVLHKVALKEYVALPGSGAGQRRDLTQELSAGVEWKPVQRCTVNLGYQFSTRGSSDSRFDFKDHTVSAGVAYKF